MIEMPGRLAKIWLASLIGLAGAPGAREGSALCLGLDGHVELKDLRGAACADAAGHDGSEGHAARPPAADRVPDDCCGGCIDISLGPGRFIQARERKLRPLAGRRPLVAAFPPLAAPRAADGLSRGPAVRPGCPPPVFDSPIATTVLLI